MADNYLIEKVFGNPLIWQTLGSYLSFREFADLRQVNRLIKESIDDLDLFKDQCWKSYYMLTSSPKELIPQDDSYMICRNVKIVFVTALPNGAKNGVICSEILPSMKGLKISQFLQTPRGSFFERGRAQLAPPDTFQQALELILKEMPKLETFASNVELMCKLKFDSFGKDFSNLKKFVVFRSGTSSSSISIIELDRLTRNMTLLSEYVKNLQNIGVVDDSIGVGGSFNLMTAISSTLQNSISTLRFIEIMLPKFWEKSSPIFDVIFPSLTCVKIQAKYESKDNVTKFLDNQPLLEHLKLAWKDYFPKSAYDVISRKSSKLRLLHVKARCFGPSEDVGNWDFLRDLQFLEDFEIKSQQKISSMPRYGSLGSYDAILEVLPPKNIRRLHIRGLSSNIARIDSSILFRFPILQEVRILRCNDIFDDNVLQALFSNQEFCRRILAFEFSHCNCVTNNGLIGTSASINNMKNLNRLTVKRCPSITDAFLNKLSLPNLKFLDISSNKKLQQNAIAEVALRCPQLEILRSSWKMRNHIQSLGLGTFIRLPLVEDDRGNEDYDSSSD